MRLSVSHDYAEQHLVERVRQGDGAALRMVFERHAPAMHRLAFHLLGSRDDADDVVQDVFVGLRASLVRCAESGSFEAWLQRLTTRAALMRLRAERRRAAAHTAGGPSATPPAPEAILGDRLSRAIAALSPTLRSVVVLRMIEPGLPPDNMVVFFRDATSGKETAALGRYAEVHRLGNTGNYLLDFNSATSPSCAFSDLYNCPIPPKENTLKVAILAGEKDLGYLKARK